MYLAEVRIKNFRKFGEGENGEPGFVLQLKEGLNVLIGENDSGKTCVIDAIRFLLLTQSREYTRLEKEDFHDEAKELKIECIFKGFTISQAKDFLEWLGIDKQKQYFLRVFLTARIDEKDRIWVDDVRAGVDNEGQVLNSKARDLLRTIYLKPLRDAENELSARKNSRLSQILYSHPEFKKGDEHDLVEIIRKANNEIKKYFNDYDDESDNEKHVLKSINACLNKFSDNNNQLKSEIEMTKERLKTILEKIDLVLSNTKPGLGSLNQLYIATELLLLQTERNEGINLALIEEIEAHLHPQAQLRVIEYLQEICNNHKTSIQILLTTHSVTLASSIKLDNLIIFSENKAFSLAKGNTKLHDGDYQFLERFLDSTKANLFFAKGVLIVEGDAENLILPALAEVIGKKLSKYGVSIVNVGSTALLRYAKIFLRKNEPKMTLPIAVITDCDQKVYKDDGTRIVTDLTKNETIVKEKKEEKIARYSDDNVRCFVSPQWTLEFDIACSCLKTELYAAILMADEYEKMDEKLEKGKNVVLNKSCNDYLKDAETTITGWSGLDKFELAKNICEKVVLKSNSKAVAAQCFAKILMSKEFTDEEIERIRNDKYLEYLINAIDYVTGG
ncbi:MAG: putative ATP-dependent endonuclease of the family [Epulopiscium sp.]|jgi:putative ATP-dependent endonuclease of OLD family|nr:putative ATP-dependent endonuclease of the family [Candidatus Epulonipiscium sp.]